MQRREHFLARKQGDARRLERENRHLREQLEQYRQEIDNGHSLELAELIMENSNAVLFRRLAAEDPKQRKMVYVSPNISRFGYEAEEFLTGTVMFRDLVYPEDSPRTLKEIRKFTEQGIDTYNQHYRIVTRQGDVRWVEDRTSIYEDTKTGLRYHQGIVIDVHEKKVIEEKLKKSEEKHRRIIETSAEGFLLLDDSHTIIDLNLAYQQLVRYSRDELIGNHPADIVSAYLAYTQPTDNQGAEQPDRLDFECELTRKDGLRVPVLIHASTVVSDRQETSWTALFITDISSQKKALRLAAEVQKGLLPARSPDVAGLDIAGTSIPCDEIGGDYYDYLFEPFAGQGFGVAVGDITGHGVDAALLMSSARGYLKACASQYEHAEDVISAMNRHLVPDMNGSGRFMSMFYLIFSQDRRNLHWVRAGHDPALIYDPHKDRFKELKGPGLALGIDPDFTYSAQQYTGLTPDQVIILGTDGIWEAMNRNAEMFGKERLKALIRDNVEKSARDLLDTLMAEHDNFTEGTLTMDDKTLILIKLKKFLL